MQPPHKPVEHCILLVLSVTSFPLDRIVHGDERVDSSGDDERGGFMYQ